MCFEYAEICSETNSPSLIQSTLKFVEMVTILLHSLNFVPSFYDPYSLFSTIPPSAKSKRLLFQDMLQTTLKTADVI